ncbi:MAG: integrase [Candidatus Promineifilaceae bacterium]|jgi:integrase
MTLSLIPQNSSTELRPKNEALTIMGEVASQAAALSVFDRYHQEQALATIKRHGHSLKIFGRFIQTAADEFDIDVESVDFQNDPAAWSPVTWGLAQAFKTWLLNEGYAIGTVNKRIDALRVYASMASQAGFVSADELLKIKMVRSIPHKTAKNVNESRSKQRVSTKKAEATRIDFALANILKVSHEESPAGRRNALIMALLLDHGMRASEVVLLTLDSFDFEAEELIFYRPKTGDQTRHKLTVATAGAAADFKDEMAPAGAIFLGNYKDGRLQNKPLNRFTLSKKITRLGKRFGIDSLSPHDCRHYCATEMAGREYGIKELMDWFGWTSPAMAVRYIEAAIVQERNKG